MTCRNVRRHRLTPAWLCNKGTPRLHDLLCRTRRVTCVDSSSSSSRISSGSSRSRSRSRSSGNRSRSRSRSQCSFRHSLELATVGVGALCPTQPIVQTTSWHDSLCHDTTCVHSWCGCFMAELARGDVDKHCDMRVMTCRAMT